MKYSKSKKARRKWWNDLTIEQKEAYIARKQAVQTEKRKLCPIVSDNFPRITSENKRTWLKLILKQNPWLKNSEVKI